MLATIFGLILISFPFILIFCFKDRIITFIYLLGGSLVINLIIAFLTQFFHVFYYSLVIGLYSIVNLLVLIFFIKNRKQASFKIRFNWLVIIGFLISFFELWSVHFLYTETRSTINGYQEVIRSAQPYPYFSDEWVGVSLTKYSINSHSLPVVNSLAVDHKNSNFPNIFVCFFSLIAEIFLILNLNPLFGYAFLSIASGFIISLLVYLWLKSNKANSISSLIAAMSIPFIVNGANLPGIWYLIPLTGGVILSLISFIGFSYKKSTFAEIMLVSAL